MALGNYRKINNDHGNGSGVLTKIESAKILVVQSNNEITPNDSLCNNTIHSDSPSSGTYTTNQDPSSGTIVSTDCDYDSSLAIHFEIKESTLYVYYPCSEGCTAKYKKQ